MNQVTMQGSSSAAGRKFSKDCLHPQLLSSSPLPNPFLQLNNLSNALLHKNSSFNLPSRTYRGTISAKSWDLSRFLKTLYFFNGPPSPAKVYISRECSSFNFDNCHVDICLF